MITKPDFLANRAAINGSLISDHGVTKPDLAKYAGRPDLLLADWDRAWETVDRRPNSKMDTAVMTNNQPYALLAVIERFAEIIKGL